MSRLLVSGDRGSATARIGTHLSESHRPVVGRGEFLGVSRPLRDLPNARFLSPGGRSSHPSKQLAEAPGTGPHMPAATLSFDGMRAGLAFTNVIPPDPTGAVGPNHYVQMVNLGIEIFNKTGGTLVAPKATNSLWTGYSGTNAGNGCAARNDGDGIVVYDRLADRFVIGQVSLPNVNNGQNFECLAVSKTPDPTGAYYLYDFSYPGYMDQPKIGVWSNAYYETFDLYSNLSTHTGAEVCALDRAHMLAGQPAGQQCFNLGAQYFGNLPANLDSVQAPPAGSPGYVVGLGADSAGNLDNTLAFWKVSIDWVTPANSSVSAPASLSVGVYRPVCTVPASGPDACVPQKSTTQLLTGQGYRLMFPLDYHNFGNHESLVLNHSVGTGVGSGAAGAVRWYELRLDSGHNPSIAQQGTYQPPGGWRWMGSIAMDGSGNMALGYSLSSTTMDPSIAWTGRLVDDPAGTMPQAETIVQLGGGGQTQYPDWGDYSTMTLDPKDNCTFWYTNEYLPTTNYFNWHTHISAFKYSSCGAPTAAYVTRFTARQAGRYVRFQWRTGAKGSIAGFQIYAGDHALFRHVLPAHAGHDYRRAVLWAGQGPYVLRVILAGGRGISIPAR